MIHIFLVHSPITLRIAKAIVELKSIDRGHSWFIFDRLLVDECNTDGCAYVTKTINQVENYFSSSNDKHSLEHSSFMLYTTRPTEKSSFRLLMNKFCLRFFLFEEGSYSYRYIHRRYGGFLFDVEFFKGLFAAIIKGNLHGFNIIRKKYLGAFAVSSCAFQKCKNVYRFNFNSILNPFTVNDYSNVIVLNLVFDEITFNSFNIVLNSFSELFSSSDNFCVKFHPGQYQHKLWHRKILQRLLVYNFHFLSKGFLLEDLLFGPPKVFHCFHTSSFLIYALYYSHHKIFLYNTPLSSLPPFLRKMLNSSVSHILLVDSILK